MRRRDALLFAVLTVLPGAVASAEEPATPSFADALDVRVVNLGVVVEGTGGAPVDALTAADFEVIDDGRPVEIAYFAAPGRTPAAPADTRLVVFLDDSELDGGERQAMYDGLQREVDGLFAVAGEVMLVRFGDVLRVEKPFTASPDQIAGALSRLAGEPAGVDRQDLREAALLNEIRRASGFQPTSDSVIDLLVRTRSENEGTEMLVAVREHARARRGRSLRTIAALESFAAALAGLEGRIAVLLVSGGLELRPGERLFEAWLEKFEATQAARFTGSVELEAATYYVTTELDRLLATARASGVTFYTVSPLRSRADAGRSPSARALVRSGMSRVSAGDFAGSEAMRLLADVTAGGFLASLESLDEAVARLAGDRQALYSLGYPSPHGGDGELHKVAVRLRGDDRARLRYPASYRDRSPLQRLQERAAAALLLGVADNPLAVEVEVTGRRPAGNGALAVATELRVPMAKLLFLPHGDVHRGGVTAFVVTQDAGGWISSARQLAAPLEIPNADLVAAMSRFGVLRAEVELRAGDRKLAIAVRDDVGDVDSALVFRLEGDREPP